MSRKLAYLTLALALPFVFGACVIVDDGDSTLSVTNRSDYLLTEIRVAEIEDPVWGPNLLGGDVLYPDESLVISLDCGDYDALVVDELGAECVLPNLYLCYEDAEWVITNSALAQCDGFGVKAGETDGGGKQSAAR